RGQDRPRPRRRRGGRPNGEALGAARGGRESQRELLPVASNAAGRERIVEARGRDQTADGPDGEAGARAGTAELQGAGTGPQTEGDARDRPAAQRPDLPPAPERGRADQLTALSGSPSFAGARRPFARLQRVARTAASRLSAPTSGGRGQGHH